jgi:methionine-rich copper-binding protein CopC
VSDLLLSRRRFAFAAASTLSGVALAYRRPAQAHAMLRSADPPVGATVPAAPDQLSLTFSEGVEPAFSLVRVTDAAGARVDRDDLRRDPAQAARLVVGLQKLLPGIYQVEWKVTSIDTHKTEGSYSFTVLGP